MSHPTGLAAPTNLEVTAVHEVTNGWAVDLRWVDNAHGEQCYWLTYRRTGDFIWASSTHLYADTTAVREFINFGATEPTVVMSVVASIPQGLSGWSNSVTVRLPGAAEITAGSRPPHDGLGFGLFAWGGGTTADLLKAVGCPEDRVAFWVTTHDGRFLVYIPGASLDVVNADWYGRFRRDTVPRTPMIARCLPP